MKRLLLLSMAAALLMLASCTSPKQVAYFQDRDSIDGQWVAAAQDIKVQVGDQIAILVKCQDIEATNLFNLPYMSQRIGSSSSSSNLAGNTGIIGYLVDADGKIDFPTLGKMTVEGMTRQEIATAIKKELSIQGQARDAIVTVEFMNLQFSVLGEVRIPGRYNITRDQITILDAISMAGDLTIDGKRENVMVMRNDNGVKHIYNIDLTSGRDIINSPAYYLQQNDIVYVEPNAKKARTSTVNGNTVLSASFWLSLTSVITSIIIILR